jgi:hypothetical protein
MAECKQCGFPYASGSKCGNCGSTDPKGSGSAGCLLVGILVFCAIAGTTKKDEQKPNSNSTPKPSASQTASKPSPPPQTTQRQSTPSPSPSHSAPQRNQTAPTRDSSQNSSQYPVGRPSGNPGYVHSPYGGHLVDVRGINRGRQVIDPVSGRIFITP